MLNLHIRTQTKSSLHIIMMAFLCILSFGGTAKYAYAQLEITVNRGQSKAIPIAIQDFHADTQAVEKFAREVPKIINENLARSGLFKPLPSKAFIQSVASVKQHGIRFDEWRATAAQMLVTGKVQSIGNGRARVEFTLWDIFGEREVLRRGYVLTENTWRRIGHIFSDQIYSRLTGESAYFDSRIVYIAETGSHTQRKKRLAIMDQDGQNHQYLTSGEYLVLTPRSSPTEPIIAYMSYEAKYPRVYIYNMQNGHREILGDFPGMTFAPRFSPDGKKVIMSQAIDGNTDLYEVTLSNRRKKRITTNSAIDTAPSYSPDGKKIVFESDRGGSQQLYVLDLKTGKEQRITFGKGRYGNPVWSPRGDLIAFTRMYRGKFYIGVIAPNGDGERLITSAYHVEGPSWSPNGRVLVYFKETPTGSRKRGRKSRLHTVDITGFHENYLHTPDGASDPTWAALNKLK